LVRISDYLSRWRTRYFILKGNELSRMNTSDSVTPTQVINVYDAEIKTNERKFEIKIKSRRHRLDLRARDKNDFECWNVVLNRARSCKGMVKSESSPNGFNEASIELMTFDLETADDDDDFSRHL